jgi:RNA polymerase sigma-70 factor, ECF subfamily
MMPALAETSPTDRPLADRLEAGDAAAYETLVRQHAGAMLAVARRILRNEDDARDAVQDAFTSAWRAIHRFRAEAELSTWLHRIVVNASLMRLRSASRRAEEPLDDLLPRFDAEGRHAGPVPTLPSTSEDAVADAQLRAAVRAAVAELPAAHRAAIVLRDFEELTTEEAAVVLGISESAVKTRLHRARQALAARLAARGMSRASLLGS